MEKVKAAGKRKKTREKQANMQNRIAMVAITGVVCMLLVVLLVKGDSLQKRIDQNQVRAAQLDEELAAEQARTEEIEDLQEYMQSDEYIEKIAKEKIGLVKDNEIIFKERK